MKQTRFSGRMAFSWMRVGNALYNDEAKQTRVVNKAV